MTIMHFFDELMEMDTLDGQEDVELDPELFKKQLLATACKQQEAREQGEGVKMNAVVKIASYTKII